MPRAVLLVVFAASFIVTLPGLMAQLRHAFQLAPLSLDARRQRYVSGYNEAMMLRQKLGPSQPIAFIAEEMSEVDTMLFVNYYLYPRVTRRYATAFHYAAAHGEDRPDALVTVDPFRVITYAALRAEAFAGKPIVRDFHGLTTATSFIVPLVASLDGPQPHAYTTEGIIENHGAIASTVTIELPPRNIVKTLTIAAGQAVRFVDVVYELFGRLDRGWLRVRATAPVAAAFSLVDRGTGEVDAIPVVTRTEGLRLRAAPGPSARFWMIDVIGGELSDRPLVEPVDLPLGPNEYAFVSYRHGEQSEVVWPQAGR